MKACPYCAEEIQDAAIVCKHCGRDLPPETLPAESNAESGRIPEPAPLAPTKRSRAPGVITLLVGFAVALASPSLVLPGFLLMWIGAALVLATMKSLILRWGIALLVAFLFLSVAAAVHGPTAPSNGRTTSTNASSSTAAPVAATSTWQRVASWSGTGMKETEMFTTSSREWRIRWSTRSEPFPGAGILQIFVYDEDGSMVSLAANAQGPRSDTSYVRSAPGRHYLMLNSANIDYTVTVEDQR